MTSNTLSQEFWLRRAQPSDINEHMDTLRSLAQRCEHITEFGVRTGNSTIALLMGLEKSSGSLYSYDINLPRLVLPILPHNVVWQFTQADTGALSSIRQTELLFIDTLHTTNQVAAELQHAHKVSRYIVFHDTVLFGDKGEQGQLGITHAIYSFLAGNPDWQVSAHYPNNNGLLVLARKEQS